MSIVLFVSTLCKHVLLHLWHFQPQVFGSHLEAFVSAQTTKAGVPFMISKVIQLCTRLLGKSKGAL